jgi:hypothetical protein
MVPGWTVEVEGRNNKRIVSGKTKEIVLILHRKIFQYSA